MLTDVAVSSPLQTWLPGCGVASGGDGPKQLFELDLGQTM